jgi:hypothetical protein
MADSAVTRIVFDASAAKQGATDMQGRAADHRRQQGGQPRLFVGLALWALMGIVVDRVRRQSGRTHSIADFQRLIGRRRSPSIRQTAVSWVQSSECWAGRLPFRQHALLAKIGPVQKTANPPPAIGQSQPARG